MSNTKSNNYYYQVNSESPIVTTSNDGTISVDNPLFDNPENSLIILILTLVFLLILLLILCKYRFGSNKNVDTVSPLLANQQADDNIGDKWPKRYSLGPRPKVQSEFSDNRSLSTKSLSTTTPMLQTSKVLGLSSGISSSHGPSSTLNQIRIKSSAFIQKLVNWKSDQLDVINTSKCPKKLNSIKVNETVTRMKESPKCKEIVTVLPSPIPIVSSDKIIPSATKKVLSKVQKKSCQVSKIKILPQAKVNLSAKKRSSSSSSASSKSISSKSTSSSSSSSPISMAKKQRPKQKSTKFKSYGKKMIGRIGKLN